LPERLDGLPVVACSLHSQVAPVCAALGGLKVAYVQVPGGALPITLSDALRELRAHDLLHVTIGAGECFGGDSDAVNVYSALLLARAQEVDVTVCSIGPGIVGTGSPWGHGAVAAAEAANAALALHGAPILVARVSESDDRERHRGASHHTRAALELTLGPVAVAWPTGLEPPEWLTDREELDVDGWRAACAGLPLAHMGRGPDDDPWFFAAAFAAGRLARSRVQARGQVVTPSSQLVTDTAHNPR
jgi:hypothetical protein